MNDFYYAIIPGTFIFFLICFGICLIFGKGGIMIPGYNHKAKGADAEYFEKYYCRKIAPLVFACAIIFAGVSLGLMFHIVWLAFTSGLVGIIAIFAMLISVKNNRRTNIAALLAKELTRNPKYIDSDEIQRYKNELGRNKKSI